MMKRKSRKQTEQERRLAWSDAVREGRVVSYDDGSQFKAFATVAEAESAVRDADPVLRARIARPVVVVS